MSYRKIVVNGREFEYTIGHAATKVKGVGSFVNEFVGRECSSRKWSYNVTPGIVADWIQKKLAENRT